ncbi:transporter substrate-binding domain-containing protein [Microvirga soli]|uniref:transporter substrate-binding domain-containing protein n=1 Tax=Microvirga soli TaxID=1854496 RepID=UPI001FE3B566|nr:transporter substrate-binding domain-containing protein [Microvirga soli]
MGSLRIAVAVGSAISAVWTRRDAEAGEPRGPTVDLARHIAEGLGVPLTLVECASSGEIIETASSGTWDVSFAPVDAERKKLVDFGPNYFLGESTYMVPAGSPITSIEEVDRKGVRAYGIENIATIRSARKSLKNTSAIGLQGLDEALERFRNGEVDALALGKESLRSLLPRFPGRTDAGQSFPCRWHSGGSAERPSRSIGDNQWHDRRSDGRWNRSPGLRCSRHGNGDGRTRRITFLKKCTV